MAKTTASFRLSKTFKRMVALMKGTKEHRDAWKRMFIDAQHSAEVAKIQSKKSVKGNQAE